MRKLFIEYIIFFAAMLVTGQALAEQNFRYLHVTIETPWIIFIFLLVIIMFPFILTAILYWYFAYKKNAEERASEQQTPSE